MRLSFGVAKELGMTVQQLHENITFEELLGWSAYFGNPQSGARGRDEEGQTTQIDWLSYRAE